jgi:uncharacterized HAD superfamily protein
MDIAVDIDGVIAEFVGPLYAKTHKRYNVDLPPSMLYGHRVSSVLGVPYQELKDLVFPTIVEDLPLIPQAKDTLTQLWQDGHRIHIITARPIEQTRVTEKWLAKHNIPYHNLRFLKSGTKCNVNLHVDVVIEDDLYEAMSWHPRLENIILYDQPWNQSFNLKQLLTRVHSWHDIYFLLADLEMKTNGKA